MVKGSLGQVAMIRMAIDIAAGMHYLSESGFVVSIAEMMKEREIC
jgi:hypothetical protein